MTNTTTEIREAFAKLRERLSALQAIAKDGEGGAGPAGGPDASDVHVPGPMGGKGKAKVSERLKALQEGIEKALHRWPAGTPSSKGGQFAPANGGGGGGIAAAPNPARRPGSRGASANLRVVGGTGGSGGAGGNAGAAPAPAAGGGIPPRPDISRFRQDHEGVRRLHRRLDAMHAMAQAGDIEGIRAMSTGRGNSYLNTADDYRTALLQHLEPSARLARMRGTMPQAPRLTGANMQNSALLSAQRHIDRMADIAANHPNPLQALRDYRVGSGGATNIYLRQAQSHHAALLAHFGQGEGAASAPLAPPQPAAVTPTPTVRSVPAAPAAAPAAAAPAAPARPAAAAPAAAPAAPTPQAPPRVAPGGAFASHGLRGVSNTAAMIGGRQVTVSDVATSSTAANPMGMHPDDLGFIPRPNVPLNTRVNMEGIGGGRFASEEQRLLARAYLSQPTDLQVRARDYQAGSYRPSAPMTAEQRAAHEAAQRAQRQQEERATQERIRAAALAEEQRRASIPASFLPRNAPGSNVTSSNARVSSSTTLGASAFASSENLKQFSNRIIADYGGGTKFTVNAEASGNTATIRYRGDDGTTIQRDFNREPDGSLRVYHAYFSAGSRGGGAGKRFFRVSMGEYIAAGVRHVDVTANIDVGGYAWARFGYLPKSQTDWVGLRSTITSKLNTMLRDGRINRDEWDAASRVIQNDDPRTLWKVADMNVGGKKIGKDLLLGTYWKGRIDTQNQEQMRRFTAYVSEEGQ